MRRLLPVACWASLFFAACHTTATSPTRVILLTIAGGSDWLTIGKTETLAAFAVRSDGSSSTVDPIWSSDTPNVATIDSRGLVTAIGPGVATISAGYAGALARTTLRTVPSYGGRWSGDVHVVACATNDQKYCDAFNGSKETGGLFLSQVGDTVSGIFLRRLLA